MKTLLLKDIMTKNPVSLNEDDSFSRVEELIRERRIRHIPIVDKNNILKGIITQRDLYRVCPPRKTIEGDFVYDHEELGKFLLKYTMTPDPFSLEPEDTLEYSIEIMVSKKYGCIPIADKNKKLIGIITHIDILKAILKSGILKVNK